MTISKYSRIYYHHRAIAAACKELLATRKADDPRGLLDLYQDELGEELPRAIIEDACREYGVPTTDDAVTVTVTKKALIREPGASMGQSAPLHLICVCGEHVSIQLAATTTVNPCACGRAWDHRGYLIVDPTGRTR